MTSDHPKLTLRNGVQMPALGLGVYRSGPEETLHAESTALAARRVVRDSSYFHALIDPPGDVALRNIRLYPIADWPALLGFGLTTEPGGERIAGTDRP